MHSRAGAQVLNPYVDRRFPDDPYLSRIDVVVVVELESAE
jgi:hypothetical protein